MPIQQDGQNVSFRYKVQSALGTAASGASGKELPLVASPGMRLNKVAISDPSVGSDGMRAVTRHGSRSVSGTTAAVVRLGALDELIEAVCGGTWTAAAAITQATMTSITTTTSTIVAAAGSWITQGVRVGDVITLAGHATTANNSKRFFVTAVTASTITVAGTPLTLDASPDSSFTLTVHKKVVQGTTKRYFTTDTYHQDIDISLTATDCVPVSLDLALSPDAAATVTFGWVGINAASNATGASPVLTGPTTYETANMVATDAVLLKNGVAVTVLTSLALSVSRGGTTLPVVGSTTSPDVFLDNATVTGSFSVPMEDATYFAHFDAEDEISLMAILKEPEAEPYDFLAVYLPVVKLTAQPDWSLGSAGPLIGSVSFEAGRKVTTTGFEETMVKFVTSAA
jgi:hypothetical protein